jgi:hypothetical protein
MFISSFCGIHRKKPFVFFSYTVIVTYSQAILQGKVKEQPRRLMKK